MMSVAGVGDLQVAAQSLSIHSSQEAARCNIRNFTKHSTLNTSHHPTT
jgi:hypothetical protein